MLWQTLHIRIHTVKLAIKPALFDKLGVCSLLGYTVLGDNEYPIRVLNGGKSVCHDKRGPTLCQSLKRFLNKSLALVIKSTRCLVKYKYRWIF